MKDTVVGNVQFASDIRRFCGGFDPPRRPGEAVMVENANTLLDRGPAHYRTLDPQPIEVIQAWGMKFDAGNAVKYIARVHSGANGLDKNVEDLGKAIHYLELWRDRLQRESSASSQPSD